MKKFRLVLFLFCTVFLTGCIALPQAEVSNQTENQVTNKPAEEILKPEITVPETQEISLYYYNENQDKDASGNAMCGEAAVLPIKRQIAKSDKLIEDTLNLLLKGEITPVEKDQGFKTEFPLPGLSLKKTELTDGKLSLEFEDLQNKSGGGSCRVGILWFQIKKTAMQFPEVKEVVFVPETLFQP